MGWMEATPLGPGTALILWPRCYPQSPPGADGVMAILDHHDATWHAVPLATAPHHRDPAWDCDSARLISLLSSAKPDFASRDHQSASCFFTATK